MMSTLAVVVVNFNSGAHLDRCLDSVVTQLTGEAEVVVVDNASTDGSEQAAARIGGRVRLERNARNEGYARAVNRGLAVTTGDLVLILNADCRCLPEAVSQLAGAIAPRARTAVVGPCVLDEDGSVQGSARGDPTLMTGVFGRSSWLTRRFPHSRWARRNVVGEATTATPDGAVPVDWVSGACWLARRSALGQVGGFDERYFLYWEDADLCRRLRQRGYDVRYVPGARVVHTGGQSSRTVRAMAIRAFHRSAYRYYVTHVAPWRLDPRRGLAGILLAARCVWQLVAARAWRRD